MGENSADFCYGFREQKPGKNQIAWPPLMLLSQQIEGKE